MDENPASGLNQSQGLTPGGEIIKKIKRLL